MTIFHDVKLEIVRPGPAHNQLLSPLTIYTAICGESAPVCFSIDLEQHQLLDKISRLRYVIVDGTERRLIGDKSRQAAVDDMGQEVSKILAKLQNLLFEQGRALGQAIRDKQENSAGEQHMIHLRLVASASELANLPIEMAISPASTPAEGRQLLLDLNLPIVLTREIRRTRPIPIAIDRKLETKILVIAAQPGFSTVPLKNHIRALRKSIDPWVGWQSNSNAKNGTNRVDQVLKRLRILKDADINSIYKICSKEQFTHVHILAHGGSYEKAGEQRFGVILCDPEDKNKPQYVSGAKLAKALHAQNQNGTSRSAPVMVTLATCDSGAQGSLLIPGGSLAHDLHLAGIPWVIGSQFPLSKKGSTILTREFYPRVLRGDDPREALFEVRRILCTQVDQMHDWASLVVYASLPNNFDSQITQYFEAQTITAINTAMDRADEIVKTGGDTEQSSAYEMLEKVKQYLELWNLRLPTGKDMASRLSRAEFFGISGSVYKRVALLNRTEPDTIGEISQDSFNTYLRFLKKALADYDMAIDQWAIDDSKYHWVATQYLSLKAVIFWSLTERNFGNPDRYKPSDKDLARYEMAKELAADDIHKTDSKIAKAWACGSLAELALLSRHYTRGTKQRSTTIIKEVTKLCHNLIEHVGTGHFAVSSTMRQFLRYSKYWGSGDGGKIKEIADAAVEILMSDV